MAFQFDLYNSLLRTWHDGTLDGDDDDIKVALLSSAYVPDLVSHSIFADVSAAELPSANGYTAGGLLLTNKSVTDASFDADDITFVNLGSPASVSFRYGVLYCDQTKGSVVKPLMGLVLFDNTPADIVVAASNYSVQWSNAGIIGYSKV
jgi:hypothetical protein